MSNTPPNKDINFSLKVLQQFRISQGWFFAGSAHIYKMFYKFQYSTDQPVFAKLEKVWFLPKNATVMRAFWNIPLF